MRVESRSKIKTYEDIIYIARDNREFMSEAACIVYEKGLDAEDALKAIPYKKACYETYSEWYYITSEKDYQLLVKYIELCCSGYRTQVPKYDSSYANQWISYEIVDGGDYASSCYIITYGEIKKEYDELTTALFSKGDTIVCQTGVAMG